MKSDSPGLQPRTLARLHAAVSDDIGDLVTRRPLPGPAVDQIDPFLFLNHHGPQVYPPGNRGLPFGPHPHRGFETVTFILDGLLAHRDTAGHESVIGAGGVQWMTAGRGVEHSELSPDEFRRDGGPLEILQLWVNLPSRLKMTEPRYVGLQESELPAISFDDGRVVARLISGGLEGRRGPVDPLTDVAMMVLHFSAAGRAVLPAPRGKSVFLYVVRGELSIAGTAAPALHLAELNDDGDAIEMSSAGDSIALFGLATPLGEPVVAHGPFVMNSEAEIVQAIRDYQAGKFS